MFRLAVLVSGGGTNLQSLIDFEKSGSACPYEIAVVILSTKSAFALERAASAGIDSLVKSPFSVMGKERALNASREEKNQAVSDAILEECKKRNIDGIVCAGYLSVLRGSIIESYKGRIVNLHPSLLPKFGGVGMWGHHVHEAVLAAQETESGCTVHLADSGCDTGSILVQKKVPVLRGDTPETLAARIAPKEHEAIVEGVCKMIEMNQE